MAQRLRVGLIGLGNAVEPHAKSLIDLAERVEVKAAASRSPERLQAFSARFPFPTTTDIDGIFADPEIDAVWILTPPNTHLDFGLRAAAAGKHVLMEKPLDIDVAGGAKLVDAFRKADRRLGVALQHRFRPGSLRLKALLDEGALGAVASAWMTVPWWRPQAYYDQPGRCTMARDGGGCADDAGDPHTGSVPLAGRHQRCGGGRRGDDARAQGGDGGLCLGADPARQWRARRRDGDNRGLSRRGGADRDHGQRRNRLDGGRQSRRALARRGARRR